MKNVQLFLLQKYWRTRADFNNSFTFTCMYELQYKLSTLCLNSVAALPCKSWMWIQFYSKTRLSPFASSWFYNATADWWLRQSHNINYANHQHSRGALWWLRQSHSVNYANHQHSPFARRRHDICQAAARRWKLHFPRYRLVKVSWKSVQTFPRTVVWYFCDGRKKTKQKQKKTKKTSVKHIHICLIGGCINYSVQRWCKVVYSSCVYEWIALQLSILWWWCIWGNVEHFTPASNAVHLRMQPGENY